MLLVWVRVSAWRENVGQALVSVQRRLSSTRYRYLLSTVAAATVFGTRCAPRILSWRGVADAEAVHALCLILKSML
jgi:hypothetical protein